MVQAPTQCSGFAVESAERKDFKPRVTILQLLRVPSVCVLLIASLFAAGSLTFLDPLLGEQPKSLCIHSASLPLIPSIPCPWHHDWYLAFLPQQIAPQQLASMEALQCRD